MAPLLCSLSVPLAAFPFPHLWESGIFPSSGPLFAWLAPNEGARPPLPPTFTSCTHKAGSFPSSSLDPPDKPIGFPLPAFYPTKHPTCMPTRRVSQHFFVPKPPLQLTPQPPVGPTLFWFSPGSGHRAPSDHPPTPHAPLFVSRGFLNSSPLSVRLLQVSPVHPLRRFSLVDLMGPFPSGGVS